MAPELDEPAVLDAQYEHCPFTIEPFTTCAAGHFDQRYRQPVVSEGILEVECAVPPERSVSLPKKPNTASLP